MMKVDIQIYGVHAREKMAIGLKNSLSLNDDCVHYDDRPNGGLVLYTAKKAWLAPMPELATHRIALADDVEVCNNFLEIAYQISIAHPKEIISFFPYEFMRKNPDIEGLDTPYFKAHSLFGAAIMMPIEYIQPCFKWIATRFNDNIADDDGIAYWAKKEGITILTTIPSLVQHIGDESILEPGRPIRRTVYYENNPIADWSNKKIMEYRLKEWFFSNHGKPSQTKGVLLDASEC